MGVLLAAGAGRRYGGPKALAEGGAWLRTAITALDIGGCRPVLVVLGAAWVELPPPAVAVSNPDWEQGMATSLRAGLRAAATGSASVAVLHLVDLPDVGPEVVTRLLSGAGAGTLRRATYDGRPGHPVVLGRQHWDPLLALAAGDHGGQPYLTHHPGLVEVPCEDLAGGLDRDER